MWFSVSEHLTVIVYAFLMGIFFGVLFDLIRLIRSIFVGGFLSSTGERLITGTRHFTSVFSRNKRVKKHGALKNNIVFFIFDIFYATVCAMAYSLFLFHAIRGQLRWYFLASTAIGFFIYRKTAGKLVPHILDVLTVSFLAAIGVAVKIVALPVKIIITVLAKPFRFIQNSLRKSVIPIAQRILKKLKQKFQKNKIT